MNEEEIVEAVREWTRRAAVNTSAYLQAVEDALNESGFEAYAVFDSLEELYGDDEHWFRFYDSVKLYGLATVYGLRVN